MKHLFRLSVILLISLIGEILHAVIPLPVPAGIYGMALMFLALWLGIYKPETVRVVGAFLTEILPVMFIPGAVGLLESWDAMQSMLLPCCIALVPVTLIVMAVSGHATQLVMKIGKRGADHD